MTDVTVQTEPIISVDASSSTTATVDITSRDDGCFDQAEALERLASTIDRRTEVNNLSAVNVCLLGLVSTGSAVDIRTGAVVTCHGAGNHRAICGAAGGILLWEPSSLVQGSLRPVAFSRTEACPTMVAFMPCSVLGFDSFLATGACSGQLALYGLSMGRDVSIGTPQDGGSIRAAGLPALTLISKSPSRFGTGRPITSLLWVPAGHARALSAQLSIDAPHGSYVLISCSDDGLVSTWSVSNGLTHPLRQFQMRSEPARGLQTTDDDDVNAGSSHLTSQRGQRAFRTGTSLSLQSATLLCNSTA